MDGTVDQSRLSGTFRFDVAGPGDDPAIAALLEGSELPGWIALSYRAAPGRHGPLHPAADGKSLIVRDAAGTPVGMATRTVMPGYFGGKVQPIGWIGQLRLAPEFRNRPKLLRGGFDLFRRALHSKDTPWYLASILSENTRAKRLLEAGLPGFPRFEPLTDYVTLAYRTGGAGPVDLARPEDMAAIAAFLNQQNQNRPGMVWMDPTGPEWKGLRARDFLLARRNGAIVGVVALWDQRPLHRLHVAGYAPMLRRLRPLVNIAGALTGVPRLPAVGQDLASAFLSFLTVQNNDPALAKSLINAARAEAARRGLAMVVAGLAADDPMLRSLQSLRHRAYRSCIYGVTWFDGDRLPPKAAFDGMKLEIGLL